MKKLISIIGPTGIGKTKLAIEVAHYFDTEIISCDSRQFFREMKIGTAMPNEEELARVKHHFVGHLSVEDYYSIGQYESDAVVKLEELFFKNDVVVLVGGSMMYEKALAEGLNQLPAANEANQNVLEKIWKEQGLEKLQEMLKDLDEEYYHIVHQQNPRRLLRAIDVIWQTGKKFSVLIAEPILKRDFEIQRIHLQAPRETIYERINLRVDQMIANGLIDEVKSLTPHRDRVALQTVGYVELFEYLEGNWTLDFALEEIKKNSRRYAKRQETWNRKLSHVLDLAYNYTPQQLTTLLMGLSNEEAH